MFLQGDQLNSKKFICKQCNKSYDLQGSMFNHINKKHEGDKSFITNNNPKCIGRPKNSKKTQKNMSIRNQQIQQQNLSSIPKSLEEFVSSSLYRGILKQISQCLKSDDSDIPRDQYEKITKAFKQLLQSRSVSAYLNKASKNVLKQIFGYIQTSVWPHLDIEDLLPFNNDLVIAIVIFSIDNKNVRNKLLSNVHDSDRYESFEKLLIVSKKSQKSQEDNQNLNAIELIEDELEKEFQELNLQNIIESNGEHYVEQENNIQQEVPITQSDQIYEDEQTVITQMENQIDGDSFACNQYLVQMNDESFNYIAHVHENYEFNNDQQNNYQSNNYKFSYQRTSEQNDSNINTNGYSNNQFHSYQQQLSSYQNYFSETADYELVYSNESNYELIEEDQI